eukprot:CAMPEP_0167766878 /NCGR_PEP_ID=MMETSP0110_2-20121227/15659_1 /TAXON_ID=629695 /ORGANISM="Gymnochlora sp., Strain CCMP2014" /LENGTH=74 /DNA_ID=CAMNT_0007655095 /DNA_START=295 /DNA_END=519 /DNA_ORIENTATION=+
MHQQDSSNKYGSNTRGANEQATIAPKPTSKLSVAAYVIPKAHQKAAWCFIKAMAHSFDLLRHEGNTSASAIALR